MHFILLEKTVHFILLEKHMMELPVENKKRKEKKKEGLTYDQEVSFTL